MRISSKPYRTAKQWQEIILDQISSGKCVAEYCRKQSLSAKSFYSWRGRLRPKEKSKLVKSFLELKPPEYKQTINEEAIRIKTPEGFVIEIPVGVNEVLMSSILGKVVNQK